MKYLYYSSLHQNLEVDRTGQIKYDYDIEIDIYDIMITLDLF